MSQRTEQVESLIEHKLGNIFAREVEFPEGTLGSIVKVVVPPDLSKAIISISVLPFGKAGGVMKKLKGQKGHIQHLLHKEMVMKMPPKLEFRLDDTQEHVSKLESLMDI